MTYSSYLFSSDLSLDHHLNLSAGDDDDHHEEHHSDVDEEGGGDEEDSETPDSEHSHLLGETSEDRETARQLQSFMETVTSKILEQSRGGRGTLPPEPGASPKTEDRDVRVSQGKESQGPVSQTELVTSATSAQPLLQEMSEPSQDLGTGNKSVEC